jgi:hypothetical protein
MKEDVKESVKFQARRLVEIASKICIEEKEYQ